jgi:hypothetical protein
MTRTPPPASSKRSLTAASPSCAPHSEAVEPSAKRTRTSYASDRLRSRGATLSSSSRAPAMAPQAGAPGMGARLMDLPDDQIRQVAQHLGSWEDVDQLASTCKRFENVLVADSTQKLIERARTLVPPACVESAKRASPGRQGLKTTLSMPLTPEVTAALDELVTTFENILGPHNATVDLNQPSVRRLAKVKKTLPNGEIETAKHQADVLQALLESLSKWPECPQKERFRTYAN